MECEAFDDFYAIMRIELDEFLSLSASEQQATLDSLDSRQYEVAPDAFDYVVGVDLNEWFKQRFRNRSMSEQTETFNRTLAASASLMGSVLPDFMKGALMKTMREINPDAHVDDEDSQAKVDNAVNLVLTAEFGCDLKSLTHELDEESLTGYLKSCGDVSLLMFLLLELQQVAKQAPYAPEIESVAMQICVIRRTMKWATNPYCHNQFETLKGLVGRAKTASKHTWIFVQEMVLKFVQEIQEAQRTCQHCKQIAAKANVKLCGGCSLAVCCSTTW